MKAISNAVQITNCKRQDANLKKLLTKAKFYENKTKAKTFKCKRSNCSLCSNNEFIETSSYLFKNSNFNFIIKHSMSCDSQNLIYLLFCNNCNAEYIGETSNTLRKRITVHHQQIKDSSLRKLKVSTHIHNCSTSKKPNFKVIPIFKMPQDSSEIDRRSKEQILINKLKPSLNQN